MSAGGGGTLFVVATPLGNLEDASPRCRETLARAAVVYCEDTRRTGILLQHFGLSKTLLTCNEQDERRRVDEVVQRLRAGEDVALVTDAGTPCISDPGHRLVAAAHEAGLRVSPVPGPSAVTTLLSACGLPTHSFAFEGYLPRKRAARRRLLEALADEPRTLVVLEAPHRLAESLAVMAEVLGPDRLACLGREMTKLHEEIVRAPLSELAARFADAPVRGEVTIAVAGSAGAPGLAPSALRERVAQLESEGLDGREALRQAAREAGLSRRDAYRLVRLDTDDAPVGGEDDDQDGADDDGR